MRSIKPGRGPSMMGGVGALAAGIFGVIWIFAAVGMGAPVFFPLFGLVFVGMAVVNAVYNFRNATGENRYSSYDIVDGDEEPDPLNVRFGAKQEGAYCPYCGAKVEDDYAYCRKCGKKLPEE